MLLLTFLCAAVHAAGWTVPGEQCQCSDTAYSMHDGDEMAPMCESYNEEYDSRSCTVRQGDDCYNKYVKKVMCTPKPGWKARLEDAQRNQRVVMEFEMAASGATYDPSRPAIDEVAKAQDSSANCEFETVGGEGSGSPGCSAGFVGVTTESQCKAFYDFHSDVDKNKYYEAISTNVLCYGCQVEWYGGVAFNSDTTKRSDSSCTTEGFTFGFQQICVKCDSVTTQAAADDCECKGKCKKMKSGKNQGQSRCEVKKGKNSGCADLHSSGKGKKKKFWSYDACLNSATEMEDAFAESIMISPADSEPWNMESVLTYGFAGIGCVTLVMSCVRLVRGKTSYVDIPMQQELP